MEDKGIYYLGRISKIGILTVEMLIQAIQQPKSIDRSTKSWTFIDVQKIEEHTRHFVFGRLCKYEPDATVKVVDPKARIEKLQLEPNLSIASSPFIYIPAYSSIAFMRVPQQIEPPTFMRHFSEIVERSCDNFFVKCEIDPITDLKTFAKKLSTLDGIYKISAKISPPNPLFGPLWRELKEYLQNRRTEKMTVQEESSHNVPLNTELPKLVEGIIDQSTERIYEKDKVSIGDASILMAADGYGIGYVKGKRNNESVVIKTSDTIRNFTFEKQPDPHALFDMIVRILEVIKKERHMSHD